MPPPPCTACSPEPRRDRGRGSACSSARISTPSSTPAAIDGNLGVVAGIVAAEETPRPRHRAAVRVEILAFGDEEGVRFPKTLFGSSTVAGVARAVHARPGRRRGHHDPRCAARLRRRSRCARRRGVSPRRRRRLSRGAYRAGAGAGAGGRAARRGLRHRQPGPLSPERERRGGPCRHGADGAPPRRAGRGRRSRSRWSRKWPARAAEQLARGDGRRDHASCPAQATSSPARSSSASTCAPPTTRRASTRSTESAPPSPDRRPPRRRHRHGDGAREAGRRLRAGAAERHRRGDRRASPASGRAS